MSGHNPHSRLSQPVNSSSWNHLQVPSYMPRQPQLAHMSSERTLRSSPLIWPNTNPADVFYNYMALSAAAAVANSNPKNTALDINPLLSYVRTPTNAMPFNSVDLSLPTANATANPTAAGSTSTNRNSLTPSPRNLVSPGSGSSSNARFPKQSGDNEDNTNNGANKMDNNKLNPDSIAFLNEMSEQIASMRSSRNMAPSNAVPRDSNTINNDLSNFRLNGGNDKSKQRNEPMELVRESSAPNLFDNESLSNSVHLQQLLGLTAPITSSITPNLNDLSKSILSIFNNTSTTPPLLVSPKSSSNYHRRQVDTSKNCMNTMNDESLDSQSGACNDDDGSDKQQNTRYRRRKPQKTVRMPNEMNTNESISTKLDSEKINIANNECHKNDTNNSNGGSFPPFHSDAANNLPQTNSIVSPPPQTQSIDLSHHCANQELFENGLVNYSKANDLDLMNAVGSGERNDKETNLLQNHEMNGLNVFGAVNLSHLRNTNLTNDIATFPNTDDLVKKVEELVKCNEQNGFDNNAFEPMELTKSHTENKLNSDDGDDNRISNGISESLKVTNSIEHVNNHSNVVKCNGNGNGIIPEIMPSLDEKIDNKSHDNDEVKISEASVLTTIPNPIQNGEIKAANPDIDAGKIIDEQNESHDTINKNSIDDNNSVDMISNKLSNDINNQSTSDPNLVGVQSNEAANTLNESTSRINNIEINEIAMDGMSASQSESSTPKKKTVTKKKPNKHNGKPIKKNNNQKNAKFNDKSDKKSDIKKPKIKDDSANEALNKFRGPYVHVARDGTLDVINAPLNEEIAEKQSKFKKNFISHKADRNKIRGLHVSTLSNKYDAVTTDISWMCVFCKLGPHKYGLGDLFGPFILLTDTEDYHLAQNNRNDGICKSHNKIAYSHNISAVAAKSHSKQGNAGNAAPKKKRKLDNGTASSHSSANIEILAPTNEIDIFYGMTKASDSSCEVWAHEDCIVWASGVHIIGARVVGLDAAVWGSVRHQCSVCKQYGAMLSCLKRNCNNEVHVPCAKRCDWQLNEHSFQSRCSEHSLNDSSNHEESN